MIGRIAGRLIYRAEDHVLVDVNGVGYLVHLTSRAMAGLPEPGAAVAFYTDLLVREDNLQLFGFTSLLEKEWHRLLIGVQGIGAKASLAILGTLGAEGLSQAINLGDVNAVKAAKGVGPKTAQRIVIELRDKAPALMAMGSIAAAEAGAGEGAGEGAGAPASAPPVEDAAFEKPAAPAAPPAGGTTQAAQSEALSALSNLGYAPPEAARAVAEAARDAPGADTPALIRAALRLLAPKG